jgi:hypothetical protein
MTRRTAVFIMVRTIEMQVCRIASPWSVSKILVTRRVYGGKVPGIVTLERRGEKECVLQLA